MSTARRDSRPARLLLYYITDRNSFPGTALEKEQLLLKKIAACAAAGVDLIQLREKDLGGRELESLARKALATLSGGSPARLLINSRSDVALACGAHGVHLPAGDLLASDVRMVWNRAGRPAPLIGVSVHSLDEAALAEAHGADFAVFGPVFEKSGQPHPQGLEHLRQACRRSDRAASMPLLALGGVSRDNAEQCLEAGASGVAGIRLFQENEVGPLVERLRRVAESADRLIR
jgi:thiamine-phosphate pyrophosphorylase